jgi:hypothetical protein
MKNNTILWLRRALAKATASTRASLSAIATSLNFTENQSSHRGGHRLGVPLKPALIRARRSASGWTVLPLLLASAALAQAQFDCTTNNGAITITGYRGNGRLAIPAAINGLPVTGIATNAFYGSASLTSVTIPASVTNIGESAFAACVLLTAIDVDTNNPAFSSLGGVLFDKSQATLIQYPTDDRSTSYTVPGTVTSIGTDAFANCPRLDAVTIPDTVFTIGTAAFSNCTGLASMAIPNAVTNLGTNAFSGCDTLASLTIGNGLTSIAGSAFYSCVSLTNVTIPNSVTSVGDSAFYLCYALTNVLIPNGVTSIGDDAFNFCGHLASVTIPNSVTNIGSGAFMDCPLANPTIPNSVTSIGQGAFQGSGLTKVFIPASLANLGDGAFSSCPSLAAISVDTNNPLFSSVDGVLFDKRQATLLQYPDGKAGSAYVIPGTVTAIGDSAFAASALTNVTIPDSVTRIGNSAFQDSGLTSVTIPAGLTSIGDYAFNNCISLTNAVIPNSVTSIGTWAFFQCFALTGVTIPASVISIGDAAFGNCTALTAIDVDTNNPAFSSLGGVLFDKSQATLLQYPSSNAATSYTIPSTVTGIGDYAFYACRRLTSVTIPSSVTSIGDSAFESCNSLTNVTIPNSVTSIGDSAFSGNTSLTNVTIGRGVTSIGGLAFASCTSLNSVYFQGNAPSGDWTVFWPDNNATVYYLPGTSGWGSTFGGAAGAPTALWKLPYPVVLSFEPGLGVSTNGFGFTISWATNAAVVVEASTSLVNPAWTPLATNALVGGTAYFNDPQWTSCPARFYRVATP